MVRGGYVYILTNKTKTTLYCRVTANLARRVSEHKQGLAPSSFTSQYNVNMLVYYEGFQRIEEAIAREKQIKAGSRLKKEQLINSMNPDWEDLFEEVIDF